MTTYIYILVDEDNYVTSVGTSETPVGPPLSPPLILVSEMYQVGDVYLDGIGYHKPSQWTGTSGLYTFDFDNLVWTVDQGQLLPYITDALSAHRDDLINNAALVTSEFNSELLGLGMNDRTFAAVKDKGDLAILRSDVEGETVNFKFSSFTSNGIGDVGYRDVDTSFLQDFFVKLDDTRQTYFDAERTTMSAHQSSNFISVEAALAYYDNLLS